MLDIEQAIRDVGTIYQALTGHPILAGHSDLPPELDARAHVEDRYRQLQSILEPRAAGAAPFAPTWAPPLSVIEHEAELRFELDVPRTPRDQIGVEVLGDCLWVRGGRSAARAPGEAVRYTERARGAFQRVIPLPARARYDGIQATLHEGVLAVTVPVDGAGGAARTIEIR